MDYEFVLKMAKLRPKVNQEFSFNDHVRIGRGSYGQVFKAKKKTCDKYLSDFKYYALKEVELTSYSPSTCREIAVGSFIIIISRLFFFHR